MVLHRYLAKGDYTQNLKDYNVIIMEGLLKHVGLMDSIVFLLPSQINA